MNDSRHIFLTGLVRALETGLLDDAHIERLIEAPHEEARRDILRETVYGEAIDPAVPLDLDGIMEWRRAGLFRLIERFTVSPSLDALMRSDYDYHNLRVMVKKALLDIPYDSILVPYGIVPVEVMEDIFASEEYHRLPGRMEEAVISAVESWYLTRSPLAVDLTIDALLFADLLDRSRLLESEFLTGYCRLSIDLANMKTFYRAGTLRRSPVFRDLLFVPGGSLSAAEFLEREGNAAEELKMLAQTMDLVRITGALTEAGENPFALERECDNTLTEYLRAARYLIWGLEPAYAYSRAVERELQVLGIVISARRSGMDRKWIMMRKPETYTVRT